MLPEVLPIYFFSGPEIGLKRERIESIDAALSTKNGQKPERHRFFPYTATMGNVVSLMKNGSLFSAQRLVIIADVHALKKTEIKILLDYISTPSPEVVLILTTDETPSSRAYPRSLANALEKKAVEIFWEMFERDKRGWVMRFFHENKRSIDRLAVDCLLDVTEGTSDALKEACTLLVYSSKENEKIEESAAEKILEHSREETIYSLFHRFCQRDLMGVLGAYHKLIRSDPSNADRILSLLVSPVLSLRDFAARVKNGKSLDQAATEMKLRGGKKARRFYAEGVRRYEESELASSIQSLTNLEAWLRQAPRELRGIKTELWFCRVIGKAS